VKIFQPSAGAGSEGELSAAGGAALGGASAAGASEAGAGAAAAGASEAGARASAAGGADEVGGLLPLLFGTPLGVFGTSAADPKLPPPGLPGHGVTLTLSRAPETACQPSVLAPPPVKYALPASSPRRVHRHQ
jgi:hypothetical protein